MNTKNPFDIDSTEPSVFETNVQQNNVSNTEANIFDDTDSDEEDENEMIWIVQKIIWSIVKSIVFLSILGGLVWFVWGGKSFSLPNITLPNISFPQIFSSTKTVSKNKPSPASFIKRNTTIKEKEISSVKQTTTSPGEKNPGALLVRWSLWMHRTQTAVTQNDIEKTLKWQLGIQNYFGNDILSLVSGPTLANRTEKVQLFEERLRVFKIQGTKLQRLLTIQKQTDQLKLSQAQKKLKTISNQLESKLKTKNYFGFNDLLKQKQAYAYEVEKHSSEVKIRTYLIKDIQNYQKYLTDLNTKLNANKTAILSDIRVKPFTNDPFKRLAD